VTGSDKNTGPYEIVELGKQHLDAVAELHALALPRGFLSTLGRGFIGRLYLGIAAADHSVVYVAQDSTSGVLGFISGTLDVRTCYRDTFRSRGVDLAIRMVPNLGRPSVWKHAWETLTYPIRGGRSEDGDRQAGTDIHAELLSVAVSEKARGRGVGRALIESMEATFRSWGHDGPYRVVTDAQDPRSNAFYVGTGFSLLKEFRHHGHPMTMYVRVMDAGNHRITP